MCYGSLLVEDVYTFYLQNSKILVFYNFYEFDRCLLHLDLKTTSKLGKTNLVGKTFGFRFPFFQNFFMKSTLHRLIEFVRYINTICFLCTARMVIIKRVIDNFQVFCKGSVSSVQKFVNFFTIISAESARKYQLIGENVGKNLENYTQTFIRIT